MLHRLKIFFEKLFIEILFTLRDFARNLQEEVVKEILFHISFLMFDLGFELRPYVQ